MSDAKALAALNYVRSGFSYASDLAVHGYNDYWMGPAGVIYYGRGDSEDLAFLIHSLLVNSGVSTLRLRTYFGRYLDVAYGWCAYKRVSDNKWIPLDPTNGAVVTSLDSITPLADRVDYYNATAYLTTEAYVPLAEGEYPYTVGAAILAASIPTAKIEAAGYVQTDGEIILTKLTCLGYGGAAGSVTLTLWTGSGVGLPGWLGDAAVNTPTLRFAGTGLSGILGTAAPSMKVWIHAGTGWDVPEGDLASSFPVMIVSGDGATARFDGYILRHVR